MFPFLNPEIIDKVDEAIGNPTALAHIVADLVADVVNDNCNKQYGI